MKDVYKNKNIAVAGVIVSILQMKNTNLYGTLDFYAAKELLDCCPRKLIFNRFKINYDQWVDNLSKLQNWEFKNTVDKKRFSNQLRQAHIKARELLSLGY